jgi:hypothetical protein
MPEKYETITIRFTSVDVSSVAYKLMGERSNDFYCGHCEKHGMIYVNRLEYCRKDCPWCGEKLVRNCPVCGR